MDRRLIACAAVILVATLSGCSSSPEQWELTAQNKGDMPCSVVINYGTGGNHSIRVDDLRKGKVQVLAAESLDQPIESVQVLREGNEREYQPDLQLVVGHRYSLVISATGAMTITGF